MKYIYGLNKSGKSIIDYLDSIKEKYYCWDDDYNIRKNIDNKASLQNLFNLDLNLITESFITPGISFKNSKIKILKDNKIKLFRDLELYSRLVKNKKIIAITGTNGKSTTAKLISDILSFSKINNFLGGNIGIPLMDFVKHNKKINYHVLELSSFQLESAISFKPYVSILLNIMPDHLDRYKDINEYSLNKEKITNLDKNSYNIISIDDENSCNIFRKNKGFFIPISSKEVDNGIFYNNNCIIDNYFEINKKTKLNEISPSLYGSFNMQNIMAAYIIVKILRIKEQNFLKVVSNFKGLAHRLEKIFHNNSMQIINNSKATNVDSTIKSIMNYKDIFLIMGGRAKEKIFTQILDYKENIKKIYLIGESAKDIFVQLKDEINCEITDTLEITIKNIFRDFQEYEDYKTILFSPACTSFDQFNSYEHRGNQFKKIIYSFIDE